MASRTNDVIEELSLVAKVGSRPLYAGWTSRGLPILTSSDNDLSESAREDLRTFKKSGLVIPKLSLRGSHLDVAVATIAGSVQDIKDTSRKNLAQDTIKVTVTDSSGSSYDITLGELEILKMIADCVITFQRLGTIFDTVDRQEAVEIYSLFLQGTQGNGDTIEDRPDLLLLLKPTNDNLGNIIDTIIFASDIIKKLINNDRRQPAGYKKGYLEAEDEAEKVIASQGPKGLLGWFYEPVNKEQAKTTMKNMITDLFFVPADGSKSPGFFMEPVENKKEFSEPTRENLNRLRTIASKMFLFAHSRINPD